MKLETTQYLKDNVLNNFDGINTIAQFIIEHNSNEFDKLMPIEFVNEGCDKPITDFNPEKQLITYDKP